MGVVTARTIVRSDGTVISDVQQKAAFVERDDDIVLLHYDYGKALLPQASNNIRKGMWRYQALLPLEDGPLLYPLIVGNTPLVATQHLRRAMGLPKLWLKDETRTPTGSNKDRATALVLEQALRQKRDVVTCASTGNVAVSLAIGAAAAQIKAVIFVAETVSDAKLQLMLLAGATVVKVKGGYDAAFELSQAAAQRYGWHNRNTGVNPHTLEAKKTVALEIWEQLDRQVPDVVLVSVGDGITLSGIAKGFRELQACGVVERVPRLIGVQAEHCQPLKQAWERGALTVTDYNVSADTIADGIAVDVPSGGALALKDVRESEGAFVAVSDQEMLQAIQLVARTTGMIIEPAAAAAFAGLVPALNTGLISPQDTIVVHITGSGLKRPEFLHSQRRAVHIEAHTEALDEVLAAL